MKLPVKNLLLILAGVFCGFALVSKSVFASAVPILILGNNSFYDVSYAITPAMIAIILAIVAVCFIGYLILRKKLKDREHKI